MRISWTGLLLCHLVSLSPCHLVTGPARAQAPGAGATLREVIQRADKLYRGDQLLQAEELYRQALDRTEGPDRRHCFDQLLAIYVRVGRQDQAIGTGLEYERWLRKNSALI